ncbi:peptidyl-prolyl cis-trans isomerase D [Malonomonas rubra DSM 5091]|uniref:Periplasmic chaperone PpiD n=1 Tax=Malonomonas rubra DSM 5091 TaxID=1122189 RepID=A0A1M6C276_MALRU|nr:SurA N-terminal domain-containing protein [Malonomonas rubra]SHI54808.1 peptidyl-prolyl cis-trans isomerase D [Malonomonas rubra DSM 5091]
MLDFVRNKQKSILIKIAFGLIILSFVIGYTMLTAPTDGGSGAPSDVAARVNGNDISYTAFQSSYSNLYNLYQSIYQGNFNAEVEKQLNLPLQAMQQLVQEVLLIEEANKLGLDVSKEELVAAIAQYDAFKENGVFNRNRYLQVLNYQRMTPEQFEAAQERQLLTEKVRTRLQAGVTVSEEELKEAFHKENDKINLNYCWLTPALVESKVKVTDDGLAEFFAANKELFRIEEKVSLRYLQFDPARYEAEVANFSDDELDRFYRRHLDLYETKEEVKAAHILLRVSEDATDEIRGKRKELAADLLKQLQEGADFAELAKAHSDDKGTAENGGDLGTFGRGIMVKAFEAAAFALKPGELSDIVETPFGYHIIKVEEASEAGVKPLVDVIDDVKAGLKIEKARQLAYEKAMDAYNINRKSGDLDAAAKANDLGIKETGLFDRNGAIDGIGKVPAIVQAAFDLKSGELARPVQTTQGIFLIGLKEQQPSRLPELSEVKAQVEAAYRVEQAQTFAKELADRLLAKAQEMKSLRKAAAEENISVEESGEFPRSFGSFIPKIGKADELAEEAFSLTADTPIASKVYEIDNKFLVASLKESKPADFASLETAGLAQLRDQLLAAKKENAVADKVKELLESAEIEVLIPELANSFNKGSNQ